MTGSLSGGEETPLNFSFRAVMDQALTANSLFGMKLPRGPGWGPVEILTGKT